MRKLVRLFLSALRSATPPAPTSVLLLLLGGVLLFGWVARSRADLHLDISFSGTNAVVTWTNADAALQTSLTVTGAWTELTEAASPYPVPTTNPATFFRLHQLTLTSAVITDLEPAFLPVTGGTFYLVGTNFDASAAVFVGGLPAASVTFINSNLLLVTVGALGAGTYDVSVVNPGQTGAVLANGLTVESTPLAGLETPPGMSGAAAGELRLSAVDMAIPSGIGPGFVLARTYRSRLGPTNSPMGNGWDFSYNIFIETNGSNVIIHDGTGRADTFYLQGDGTYSRAGFFRQGTFSGGVFTLTFADKSRWVFNALNAAVAPGQIAAKCDRNGVANTFDHFDTNWRLKDVVDALDRTNRFFYDGSGHLTNVTDFIGRTTTYTYDGNGNLATATTPAVTGTPNGNDFPNGKTTTYTYTSGNADENLNHNLTSVIDPTGTVVLTNQYSASTMRSDTDSDHMVSTAEGTNPPTMFSYEAQTPSPANRYATTKVYVNDPVGNVSTALFDSRNRPVQVDQYTGRSTPGVPVTSSANQPTGKLRSSDPAFYETTYSYNLDSRPTQIVYPRSNSVAMVYAYDANNATPVRERGNRLTMTQTPAPGVPADQSQRVEHWQYQSGLGTGEGFGPNEDVRIYWQCQPGSGTGEGFGPNEVIRIYRAADVVQFPINHTDARGNVTTAAYDANGNLLTVQPPSVATGSSYSYNAAGQLTAQTHPADANARRQQDTFSYYASGPQKGYPQSAVADAGAGGLALTTSYAYDAVGNVTNVVDPRGNNSQFVYNQLNQLMRVSSPTGPGGKRSQTDISYDAGAGAGREGTIHQGYYDEYDFHGNGRVISQSVQNFDQNGNAEADATLSTSYGYDAIGRLTSVTNQVSGAAVTVTRHGHDANGQVTSVMSPLAASGADAFNTVQTSYDERGLPFQQTRAPGSAGQATTQYGYDANGNLAIVSEGLEGTPRTTTIVNDGFAGSGSGGRAMAGRLEPVIDFNALNYRSAELATAGGGAGGLLWDPPVGGPTLPPVVSGPSGPDIHWDPPGGGMPIPPTFSGGVDTHGWLIDPERPPLPPFPPGLDDFPIDPLHSSSSAGSGVAPPGPSPIPPLAPLGPGLGPERGGPLPPAGPSREYPYDAMSNKVKHHSLRVVTDPLGNTVTNHYDANDNLVSTSVTGTNGLPGGGNVLLSSATAQYDALNRLTNATAAILDPNGNSTGSATTTAALADNGQTTALTDANGHTTTYAYDTVSRLSTATDPKGNSVTCAYDANGNVTAVTNRLKSDLGNADLVLAQTYAYDNLNRVTSATDGTGNAATYAYDSRGNLTTTTDARGIASQYQYDGLNRLTASGRDLDGDGAAFGAGDIVTAQSYDANSRVISSTDPKGNTTSYTYNARNYCVKNTFPDDTTTGYDYDVHGNVTSATDANGTVVSCSYDLDNRLTAKSITPGAGVASTTTFEQYSYDGIGRTVRAVNDSATNTFTYDSLDRRLTETQNGLTLTNTYDVMGNRLTTAYPGGRKLGYTYDAANLCRTVSLLATSDGDTLGLISSNSCVGGALERRDNRNGTYTLVSYLNRIQAYLPKDIRPGDTISGTIISRIQSLNTNGTVIDDVTFTYDAALNKTGKSTSYPGLTNAQTYVYDNANRLTNTVVLTNSVLARNTVYFLDKAGNRQFVSGDNHPGAYTLDSTLPQPADYQENQYTTTPVGSFTYDLNGNRIGESTNGSPVKSYTYDYANRMAGIVQYSAGGAVSLNVNNYSFEAITFIAHGTFLYSLPNGWTSYDPSNILSSTNMLGVINAVGSPFLNGTTQGTNAALVYLTINQPNIVLGLQQTLTNTLQANTSYTLNVDVGNPQAGTSLPGSSGGGGVFYNFANFPGYRLDLLAGATVIAQDINSIGGTIPEGQFRTATLNCNSSGFPGLVGQNLTLRLVNLHAGGGIEVDFDNVRLTASTSPVPAPLAAYTYDAFGRRIQKSVITGSVTNITKFVYDGGGVIEERNGAGTVVTTLTALPTRLAALEASIGVTAGVTAGVAIPTRLAALEGSIGVSGGIAIPTRLAALEGSVGISGGVSIPTRLTALEGSVGIVRINGTNYWPHTDDQNSKMALTLDTGAVAERYDYQDYGEPSFYNAAGTPLVGTDGETHVLFGGMKYDSESGFYCSISGKEVEVLAESPRQCSFDPRVGRPLQPSVGDSAAMTVKSSKGSAAHVIRESK